MFAIVLIYWFGYRMDPNADCGFMNSSDYEQLIDDL